VDPDQKRASGGEWRRAATIKEATLSAISERPLQSILLLIALADVAACGSTLRPAPIVRASATAPAVEPAAPFASEQSAAPAAASLGTSPSAPAGASASTASSPPSSAAATTTTFDPSTFAGPVDNPWFPLVPGTTLVYQGTKEGQAAVDTVAITSKTKVIAGVTAFGVHHDLALNGVVTRQTDDWFAQDRQGNVWQLGRATVEGADPTEPDEAGTSEGSWEAGTAGAEPGIVMPANPRVGDSGVQATSPGKIESHVVVLFTNGTAKVPAGTFSSVLQTEEWTPFAPGILTVKAYVRGTGLVREAEIAGGDDVLELVKATRP